MVSAVTNPFYFNDQSAIDTNTYRIHHYLLSVPPISPSITSVKYLSDQIIIDWSNVPMATSYNVSINDSFGSTIFLPSSVNSQTFSNLAMNTAYNISVVAINCAGASNAVHITGINY